ncbi:MAG: error-prone DNA polymerase [Candidatus Hydrogenedentes bacterium]|nr:error-prone DNA polymerase [Candidatus Hydrogenedentota bacterium]
MSTVYAALWCKSVYSFLEGASHPDELVEEAHRLGIRSLALTDRDGVYGLPRAHKRARELGVHLIAGSEVSIDDGTHILLLAMDRGGYANLCRLISAGRLRCPKGQSRVSWEEVCARSAGLIALWGGAGSRLLAEAPPGREAGQLREAFGDRLYALLTRHREVGEGRLEHRLRERARALGLPVAAGMETLYHTPTRRPLQDVLTCIRHGVSLGAAGVRIKPNDQHYLRAPHGFAELFGDDPEAVEATAAIAARCTFSLAEIRYRYPVERLPDGSDAASHFRDLTYAGAADRYPEGVPEDVRAQLDKELDLIRELEFEGYFLTMREIVQFCRREHILCQGRGSAANSAVCYCLGITSVDPVRMGLLFERFLSRERNEPPDIDLDIEHNRREEAIQYVYRHYGRGHAAMVANFIRYRAKSAVRDVGKALGIAETALERLARHLSHHDFPSAETLRAAGLDPEAPAHRHLLRLVREIEDVPRHLSIHPGGFLLGHEPVDTLVPIENGAMADRTVIQWDKEDIEDLGLFKVDLLGLGALNVVHKAFDLIEQHEGARWTLATIPPDDAATFAQIQRGDTVGVFQIESRAQMAMLPRLRPRNYYDLVIEVSIVRPGPITGGMVHPYLRRRNGEEAVTYPHPCLEPVLKKTLGIPLFQEQVMQLAMVAADYTPGEADQLRRDMAAWRKSGRILRHRDRLISRMMKKGIAREFAERVFEQIQGFGEYGFPESHAASFALIAYATAWLKQHYPAAFLAALLNAQPMGFYSPATLVEDAKRHGVAVRPIDVRYSDWECTLEESRIAVPAVLDRRDAYPTLETRMGLRFVKGLQEAEARRIIAARETGAFASLEDFALRARLPHGALTRLAEAGALAAFADDRRSALWRALGLDRELHAQLRVQTPEPDAALNTLSLAEAIHWDYAYTSHSTHGHPIAPYRDALAAAGLPDAATVAGMKNGSRTRYAGLVICRQRPGTANGVVFMTLEDETGLVNLVVWETVYQKHRTLVKTQPFIGVTGKLQVQSGVTHLVAEELWVPETRLTTEETRSRDFH